MEKKNDRVFSFKDNTVACYYYASYQQHGIPDWDSALDVRFYYVKYVRTVPTKLIYIHIYSYHFSITYYTVRLVDAYWISDISDDNIRVNIIISYY